MSDMNKINYTAKVENLPKSKTQITVTVAWKEASSGLSKAKNKVLSEAEIKGFRKGSVTEDVFVKQFGTNPFFQELAYTVVDSTYVSVLTENKILAIARPDVNLSAFGDGVDIVYTITVDVMPEMKLPEYKNLHKTFPEVPADVIGDEDVEDAIKDIKAWRKQKPNMTEEEKKAAEAEELSSDDLKAMGVESGNIDDLKAKIKENLISERLMQAKDKRRGQILEKLISDTEGDVPEAMIDNELLKIQDRITADLSQMGVNFTDYLKHMNKSEAEWKETQKYQAEKNAKLQVLLSQISRTDKIAPSEAAVAKEVAHLKLHYPNIDDQRLHDYSLERMINTFVLEYIMTGEMPNEEELFKIDHEH